MQLDNDPHIDSHLGWITNSRLTGRNTKINTPAPNSWLVKGQLKKLPDFTVTVSVGQRMFPELFLFSVSCDYVGLDKQGLVHHHNINFLHYLELQSHKNKENETWFQQRYPHCWNSFSVTRGSVFSEAAQKRCTTIRTRQNKVKCELGPNSQILFKIGGTVLAC